MMKQLRQFLLDHPLLVINLGFRLHLDPSQPYGFDIERTIPKKRWWYEKLRLLDPLLLQDLFAASIHALQAEIPALGETIAIDVKHIYAWVKENNPRMNIKDRFCKELQPTGDADCKLGVKRSTNKEQPDGSIKEQKEYLWGYGIGVVAATIPPYGDVVLGERTRPFNETDVTSFLPLWYQTVFSLKSFPTYVTADAAYDAWYVYQSCALRGGLAAIPLNEHGHTDVRSDRDGNPICAKRFRMIPSFSFQHSNGYRAQRYRCPLLFPETTGRTCDHPQFRSGKGCVKDPNAEPGGLMRVTLDRTPPLYKVIYCQRTCAERINSQTKELGIERPCLRNQRSIAHRNTLISLIINTRALQRVKSTNRALPLTM